MELKLALTVEEKALDAKMFIFESRLAEAGVVGGGGGGRGAIFNFCFGILIFPPYSDAEDGAKGKICPSIVEEAEKCFFRCDVDEDDITASLVDSASSIASFVFSSSSELKSLLAEATTSRTAEAFLESSWTFLIDAVVVIVFDPLETVSSSDAASGAAARGGALILIFSGLAEVLIFFTIFFSE